MDGVGSTERVDGAGAGPAGGAAGPGGDAGTTGGGAGHDASRRALGGFLRARRERVAPEHVGLSGGRRRRVRGLRREELAQLAGISVDYYVRLEQGRATQPSAEVLDALAGALGLGATERGHLATLAAPRHSPAPRVRVGPLLQRILDAAAPFPAFACDHRLDVVAWNAPATELLGGLGDPSRRDLNNARYLFLDPAAEDVFPDRETRAAEAAGQLRVSAGRYPDDAALKALVAELSVHSELFRTIWATGEVLRCAAGRKRLRHPVAGVLELDYQTLGVPAATGGTGLQMHVFSAVEGSAEAAAIERLMAAPPVT
ncbi:helix-turn-helix domain-containing protein [Streptomyces sp. NPDC050560]|uniref:MmyB family transcriptional regulator n=1 Tax=Streptomyces sp. NPDC050560 TaxID=3365630 RepID=UPI0037915A0E